MHGRPGRQLNREHAVSRKTARYAYRSDYLLDPFVKVPGLL